MTGIACKNGKIFSACVDKYIDAEWKLQEAYYKAQGCVIIKREPMMLESCECEHCKTLEHNFEDLIEEIKN